MSGRAVLTPAAKATVIERLRAGDALAVLAAEYGVTPTRLSQIGRAAGLPRRRAVVDQASRERAAAMYAAGASGAEIARETGLGFDAAKHLALRRGLRRAVIGRSQRKAEVRAKRMSAGCVRRPRTWKTQNFRAALISGEIAHLMRVEGATKRIVAARYSVSVATVNALLLGSGLGSAAAERRREMREQRLAQRRDKRASVRAERIAHIAAGIARGKTLTSLAREINIDLSYASRLAKAGGIAVPAGKRKAIVDWDAELSRALAMQESVPELAHRLGIARHTVWCASRRLAIKLPRKQRMSLWPRRFVEAAKRLLPPEQYAIIAEAARREISLD